MDPSILFIAVLGVAAALVAGWFLGRARAQALAEERARLAGQLQARLDEVSKERDEARAELAGLRAETRNFEARQKELVEAKEALSAQFSEIGARLLGEAQKAFLERADARFGEAGKLGEEKLKSLLKPVEKVLEEYKKNLAEIEKARAGSYGELNKAIELLSKGQAQVRDETARLVNALRSSPKARGRWGEQSLKNVLEQAGLSPYADFQSEVSVATDDGRLRPDVIVRLPGGRKLIIDAKCSLNAFLDASEEVDEERRLGHLKAHAVSIRNHAQQLGGKNYWERFGEAADYVVMYIPGEHFLTAALEQDEGLWDWAFERRVLLATPTNLVAIARTVANVWRQEKIAEEAAEIARLGKELHARLATMGGHVARLGRNLELASGAYNKLVGSLESQVMTQARRFEALEVSSGAKEIDELPVIETSPRPLTKLDPKDEGPAEAAE
ncbi:MAG: DNA recombination protein RmuC [Sphingomonadaceae bacterium]